MHHAHTPWPYKDAALFCVPHAVLVGLCWWPLGASTPTPARVPRACAEVRSGCHTKCPGGPALHPAPILSPEPCTEPSTQRPPCLQPLPGLRGPTPKLPPPPRRTPTALPPTRKWCWACPTPHTVLTCLPWSQGGCPTWTLTFRQTDWRLRPMPRSGSESQTQTIGSWNVCALSGAGGLLFRL